MVRCVCKHCGGPFEFNAGELTIGESREIECPHCRESTTAFLPPPLPSPSINSLTIGDIAIMGDSVITPNGSGKLAEAQWLFSDFSRTETKIPTNAIVLAIVFAFLCLIGLLFLLMKEKVTTGYVEVTVRLGDVMHRTSIPVTNQTQIDHVRQLVGSAQSMSMAERAREKSN
jgi:hypothetical protein